MRSIKTKIMVFILPLVLITIIGISILFYRFVYDEIYKNTYAELDTSAFGYSWQVQEWFAKKAGAIKVGARGIESTDGTTQSILRYLQYASEDFVSDGAAELYMGTNEGDMIFLSGSLPDGYDPRERPWYTDAAKVDDVEFTEPYLDASGRYDMSVSISVRVKEDDGSVKGVLATDLSLGFISEQTRDIKLGETGYIFAVDNRTGMIVLHPDNELLGKNIVDIYPEFKQIMVSNLNDSGKYNSYKERDGKKYWVSDSSVDMVNWTLFAVKSEDEALEPVKSLMYIVSIIVISVGIILVLVLIYFISRITKPIKGLVKEINQIGSGDFSKPIPDALIRQKDEIGIFAQTVEQMRLDIRNIISNIVDTSIKNNTNITTIFEKMDYLNAFIKEVSETAQELSYNVKEMVGGTEKTSKDANVMAVTINGMAVKSLENVDNMEVMKNRANDVMAHSKKAQEQTSTTRQEVEARLQDAMNQSKVIEKISVLSDTIMEITGQTNLLALNAAIEAARAGDSGRGFAVVADEISKLAANSKNAVSQIQNVIVQLQNAVGELVKCSSRMLEFFKEQVINDYADMVTTGEQYYQDAIDASSVFQGFSRSTDELNSIIGAITEVLYHITAISQVSSEENQKIAERSVLLLSNSNDIIEIAKDTKAKSTILLNAVEKFKI